MKIIQSIKSVSLLSALPPDLRKGCAFPKDQPEILEAPPLNGGIAARGTRSIPLPVLTRMETLSLSTHRAAQPENRNVFSTGFSRSGFLPVFLFLILCPLAALAQTGGSYDLSHNVIAGGGSQSTGGTFTVDGTIGQNLAGTVSSGGGYGLRGGFWAFQALAPTAAGASISGQIRNANGQGIRNVRVVLADPATGESLYTLSSTFGFYRFEEVTVGQTYILTVSSKRFSFNPDTRVITLLDEAANEDFNALPLKR